MNSKQIKLLEKGFASQQAGDLKTAEIIYLKVLEQNGESEFALNLMGVVCVRSGRPKKAIEYLTRALRVNSSDPETHNNLGLAHKELNNFTDAQAAFRESIRINPRQPTTLNNLGNVLASVDRHAEAIVHFENAIEFDRQYVDCLNNLSVSLREVSRLDHALRVANLAINIDSKRGASYNNKGEIFLQTAQYKQAKAEFERAINLGEKITARINLATTLKNLGDEMAAAEELQQVLAAEPRNAEALNNLGVLHEQMGDMALAASFFRCAIKSVPNYASSYYQLSKMKGQRLAKNEIAKIHELLEDPQLPGIFKSSLYFALAYDFEKDDDFQSSIGCLLKAQKIKADRNPFDESAMLKFIADSRGCFPIAAHKNNVPGELPTPVFIVGMPRSGTTLIEQVISSHSEITGAGEVGFINEIVRIATEITMQPFPKSLQYLSSEQASYLRETYLAKMIERCGGEYFVVDKNPLNFNFVGLIASIFPDARILYCKRESMDNCVSIFRLPFDDNQGYSHDLRSLGLYYRQHEELMEFWLSCYPDQILQVDYEATVEHLENQARRILSFIGVDFEVRVLDFFNNKRIVMTPSAEQVRQPIYKTSVNAWRRYGDAVSPLMDVLSE